MINSGGDTSNNLVTGLFRRLIDLALQDDLLALDAAGLAAAVEEVDVAELPQRIGELASTWVAKALADVHEDDRAAAAQQLATELMATINRTTADPLLAADEALASPISELTASQTPHTPTKNRSSASSPTAPKTPAPTSTPIRSKNSSKLAPKPASRSSSWAQTKTASPPPKHSACNEATPATSPHQVPAHAVYSKKSAAPSPNNEAEPQKNDSSRKTSCSPHASPRAKSSA